MKQLADQHVVVLVNYLRRHHVLTFKEFAKHVGKLTILVSTPMEGDRAWLPEWEGLNVIVQKNSTLTLSSSSGFDEKNFIHFPWDTVFQLRRLKPDVVLSYEMGVRTLFCSMFRLVNRSVPLIMVGNMSEYIETKRGFLRRLLRKVIRHSVDYCTYNGPSCKKYLKGIGLDESRLFYFPYCFDGDKTFRGDKHFSHQGVRRLLYCGALSERKAILPFAKLLGRYCDRNLDYRIELVLAGDGPLADQLAGLSYENLNIKLLGPCGKEQLRQCYKDTDVCVFPTRGDEWGLVPIEAWASGVPVLGSHFAQSIEMVGENGVNGWVFDINDLVDTRKKISEALATSYTTLTKMAVASRESVSNFSANSSALYLAAGVKMATGCSEQTESKRDEVRVSAIRSANPETIANKNKPLPTVPATISLDLDNKWSYLKSHNNPAWEALPSYLNHVVPRILSVLDDLDLKITFFVVGQDAVIPENQDAIRMIAERGHEIANHSFHHEPSLHLYSQDQLECEFEMAEEAIRNLVGTRLLGFRGPGFSMSEPTLKLLSRRGYLYDCTTFPTYLAPVARAFYFMTGSFSAEQKRTKQGLFGKFSDGFAPNHPFLWKLNGSQLLEIPVTTMPGFKTPVHATYLHYLASFSPLAAKAYWAMALSLYQLNGVSPSFLLHPLDFLGCDDEPDLAFFPGMKSNSTLKMNCIRTYIEMIQDKYQVVPMRNYANMALNGELESRSANLVRSGVS